MATTYYIPDETGWGQAALRMRAKVVQNYNSSNNTSELTVTLQLSSDRYNQAPFQLRGDAKISLNGAYLVNGSSTTTFLGTATTKDDGKWYDLSVSWTATVEHADNGSATASISIAHAFWYCQLYGPYSYTFDNKTGSKSIGVTRTFTLTIDKDTNSVVTIKKNGSVYTGSSITYGDTLVVTFGVNPGYELTEHKVNGTTRSSGYSFTVTEAVTVKARCQAVADPDSGVRIYGGSSWDEYKVYIFNGAAWDEYVPYIYTGSGWVKY